MKRALLWLNPKTGLRGLVFGFLFGFVWWLVFLSALGLSNSTFVDTLEVLLRKGPFGFGFAIPWAIIWCASGAVCSVVRGHPGTLATLVAIAFGVGYSFWEGPKHLHPWLPITVPFYTFIAIIPCHLLGFVTASLFERICNPEGAK